ncbi:MAG: response regulator [Ferruginibacter sp.]
MAKSGPIIIIEDDNDDIEILSKVLHELRVKNELLAFSDTTKAFAFLKETSSRPFLIFCDVNLPGENGLEFKQKIDDDIDLRRKSIPFIFYSTSADQASIDKAYTGMTVQGFFEKGVSYEEIMDDIGAVVNYWKRCKHPNIY